LGIIRLPAAGAGETTPKNHEALEQQLRSALKVEEEAPGKFRIGLITFDAAARTVSLPAKVNMRGGVIEYALTTEAGKAHEALLTTTANPRDLHVACLLLGMKAVPPGPQKGGGDALPESEGIRISVLWETNGPAINRPLCALMAGGRWTRRPRQSREGPPLALYRIRLHRQWRIRC
jgi:hypothetical protein